MEQTSNHTIVLMQQDEDSRTRTYLHYSSLGEAIESLLTLYELNLKKSNPDKQSGSYEIQDFYTFLDNLTDLILMEFNPDKKSYFPRGRDWIKVKCFNHLKQQTG
eukprot:TRINITY_DN7507_c0_g1_i1.p1 TRINITY_DN7507_c0_g1~~TRINITY_DN7507_c0_g1_i1.p1  ORF type:complete len:105 (+),score=9.27 TRINITY_DN7507_c0_g1_i1:179-493(+)